MERDIMKEREKKVTVAQRGFYDPGMQVLGLILGYRSGGDMAHTAVGDQFILGVSLTGFIVGARLAAVMTSGRSSYDTDTGLPPISVHLLDGGPTWPINRPRQTGHTPYRIGKSFRCKAPYNVGSNHGI